MKTLTLSILFALAVGVQAQTNSSSAFEATNTAPRLVPPVMDANAIAQARSNALAFMATNVPVAMVTDTIITYPMNYPAGFPIGANMMYSTNNAQWSFARSFDITKTNCLKFTNQASGPHFWLVVLMPPHVLSISNQTSTNQ